MEPIKKRKIDETVLANVDSDSDSFNPTMLTAEDACRILEPFTRDQLLGIVINALLRHPDVLDAVRSIADRDTTLRKLFIRGLGCETTTDKLRALFSAYGELDEAIVILDKATGKSKGYGFITFKHVDAAIMALKEPSKKIDSRMTVTQLAAAGISAGGGPGASAGGGSSNQTDVSTRKIYVGNVPYDMGTERLLQHFTMYGEIEEGPLGFDKATGKSRGFALFVYKTAEAARASLVDPVQTIDGHQLNCKLAIDGKRGKPPVAGNGDGMGAGGQYGGYSGGLGANGGGVGGPGLPAVASQAAGSNIGYGSGIGGPYGGPIGTAYSGYGSSSGGPGRVPSYYGLPPSSAGMGSRDYPPTALHSLQSGGYQSQHNQQAGAPRIPPGGAYQGMPPYY